MIGGLSVSSKTKNNIFCLILKGLFDHKIFDLRFRNTSVDCDPAGQFRRPSDIRVQQ